MVFIAVGTPARRGDGHADLSYVYEAATQIAENLNGYTVVVTKSTVPVGTGNKIKNIIKKTNPEADFDVVSNPEFLREGNAIEDFMRPDRVIVGCETNKAKDIILCVPTLQKQNRSFQFQFLFVGFTETISQFVK